MNNQITSVSYLVYSNKGVFALFLGSGISKSAGIPTGWDIVIDLIKQIAVLEKEECLPNPVQWYTEYYKEEPDYSNLLEKLTNTQEERVNLLRPYFEPNEEELEEGLKQPTIAHRRIAQLV